MNLKVAHLVAVQIGMFFGIMSWLAYTQIPFDAPRPVAETRKPVAKPVATLPSAADPGNEPPQTIDYRADQEQTQPVAEPPLVPAMQHEYSAAAVQQNSALAAQLYYQQIAPRRPPSSDVGSRPVVAAPSYAKVEQQPAAVPTEYEDAPQTVAYDEPAQFVAYAQPYGFVAYSNGRSFGRRCRPAPRHDVLTPVTPRAHDRREPHFNGLRDSCPPRSLGIGQRKVADAPSCRPTQSFKHHGKR